MTSLSRTTLSLLLLSFIPQIASPASLCAEEWMELFNGKDLSGWQVNEHPESIFVKDGLLVVNGPRAHAFYVGPGGHAEFTNFHLKVEVMTTPGSNSGIYIHTKFLDRGWPNRGYEAQVNNSHTDPKQTGGLYDVKDNYQTPVKDNEWFEYEIIVEGKHIVIKINGQTITDYTEPADLDRPTRQLSSGTFAIQAHDPKSKVMYRSFKVKQL